jgi:hypothetical protein
MGIVHRVNAGLAHTRGPGVDLDQAFAAASA